jgi:hypothetical protein
MWVKEAKKWHEESKKGNKQRITYKIQSSRSKENDEHEEDFEQHITLVCKDILFSTSYPTIRMLFSLSYSVLSLLKSSSSSSNVQIKRLELWESWKLWFSYPYFVRINIHTCHLLEIFIRKFSDGDVTRSWALNVQNIISCIDFHVESSSVNFPFQFYKRKFLYVPFLLLT